MYELIQVGTNTYYMDCPTKVGIVKISDGEVVLVDSGSDKDAAKKVKKLLDANGWKCAAIYNTHSHADHIGGNQFLQAQYNCPVYAPGIDAAVTAFPVLEPTMLYGGYAMKELHNKFLMAKESRVLPLTQEVLPAGMELIGLPGHCFDMVGFRTADDVVFLADSLSSQETLEKYQVGYLYDIESYLATLEKVREMKAACFVPAHAAQTEDIAELAQVNIDQTRRIADAILDLLQNAMCFEDLLAALFERFGLTMTLQQNVLIGSTVKSYLSWLKNTGKAEYFFESNRMLWKRSDSEADR